MNGAARSACAWPHWSPRAAACGTREADRYFVLEIQPSARPGAAQRPRAGGDADHGVELLRHAGHRLQPRARHPRLLPVQQLDRSAAARPPAQLAARLAAGGAFRGAVESMSSVRGGLLLRTHLVELYHDAVSSPGTARVTLNAELSDPAGRNLIGPAQLQRLGTGRQLRRRRRGAGTRPGARPAARRGRRLGRAGSGERAIVGAGRRSSAIFRSRCRS